MAPYIGHAHIRVLKWYAQQEVMKILGNSNTLVSEMADFIAFHSKNRAVYQGIHSTLRNAWNLFQKCNIYVQKQKTQYEAKNGVHEKIWTK